MIKTGGGQVTPESKMEGAKLIHTGIHSNAISGLYYKLMVALSPTARQILCETKSSRTIPVEASTIPHVGRVGTRQLYHYYILG